MKLPRITVRRLMVLVALLALALGLKIQAAKVGRLREHYELCAYMYEVRQRDNIYECKVRRELEATHYRLAGSVVPDAQGIGPETHRAWSEMFGKEAGLYERSAATAGRWKAIYEQAARRPWTPIVVDPHFPDRPPQVDREPLPTWANTRRVPFWE